MSEAELVKLFDKFEEAVSGLFAEANEATGKEFQQLHDELAAANIANAKRFDDLESKMDAGFNELNLRVDAVQRQLNSEVGWRDGAEKRLTRLEAQADHA